MDYNTTRKVVLTASIGGSILLIIILIVLVRSNLSQYPDLDEIQLADLALEDAFEKEAEEAKRSYLEAPSVNPGVKEPVKQALPDTTGQAKPGTREAAGKRMEKLVKFGFGTPVNRKVSFNLLDNTLKAISKKTGDNKPLQNDMEFIRSQFSLVSKKVEEKEIKEAQLQKVITMALRLGRARQIPAHNLEVLFNYTNKELKLDLDRKRWEQVLANMEKKPNRRQLKAVFREEAGNLVKNSMDNALTRRLLLFGAERAFTLYEQQIYRKLPPQVSRREVKYLFYNVLQKAADKKLTDQEISRMTDLFLDSILDRKISRAEMEKITAYLKKVLRS